MNSSDHLLSARSTLYTLISALYADPMSLKFELLYAESFQHQVLSACETIATQASKNRGRFKASATKLFANLASGVEPIQNEYIKLFGHTLSKETAPYELEHLKNEDVFYRTQNLADINGFYRAFGLEIERHERADHISVESEFLAYLLLKELAAKEINNGADKIKVCQKAQADFWNDHFYGWASIFVRNLSNYDSGNFYPLAAELADQFFRLEKRLFDPHLAVEDN